MKEADRTAIWRPAAGRGTGSDECALWRDSRGWRLEGLVVTDYHGEPAQVRYAVGCDADWATRTARVELRTPSAQRYIELRAHNRRWFDGDGRELEAVHGCVDVDLGMTPATNTLPLRRLALAIGESCDVTAAWVRFPELTIEPLPQRYTRLDERRYRYESATGFMAELTVDDVGLVVDYPGGWERVQ